MMKIPNKQIDLDVCRKRDFVEVFFSYFSGIFFVLYLYLGHMNQKNVIVCRHCFNLNLLRSKNEQLPTNHFLRDNRIPSRPIVCPVLSKTQCENCFRFGHTRSYCTRILGHRRNQPYIPTKPNIFLQSATNIQEVVSTEFVPTTPSCSPPPSVHGDEDEHENDSDSD